VITPSSPGEDKAPPSAVPDRKFSTESFSDIFLDPGNPPIPGLWVQCLFALRKIGAANGVRTRDLDLGKVALYQLSYSRKKLTVDLDNQVPTNYQALK